MVSAIIFAFRLIILVMAFPVYDFYYRSEQSSIWSWIALITVSAGVAGNLLDDVFVPYTTDFIQVFHSPSANFADLFIYVCIGALAVELGLKWKKKKPHWRGFSDCLDRGIQIRRDFFDFLKEYFVRK
jgi:lipoprotein signal peptidase